MTFQMSQELSIPAHTHPCSTCKTVLFFYYFDYPLIDLNNITLFYFYYFIFMFLFIQLHSESYRTWKCEYAFPLQAAFSLTSFLYNTELIFTDCFVGFAGSVNESSIFRNSDLWMSIQENRAKFCLKNEYIINNKAYPVLSQCNPTYINKGNLIEIGQPCCFVLFFIFSFIELLFSDVSCVQVQVNFNWEEMRQVVQRAFVLLKGRFQRLK